jgi:hypothetical protein
MSIIPKVLLHIKSKGSVVSVNSGPDMGLLEELLWHI